MKLTINLEGDIYHLQVTRIKKKGEVKYSIGGLTYTSPRKLASNLKRLAKIF